VFEGQVVRMASVFDPQTNTTEAEIEIDNPDAALKPGMFGAVSVTYRTEPTALLVPASAVVEGETESHVFVAERAPEAGAGTGAGRAEGRAEGEPGGAPVAPRWVARRVAVQVVGTGSGGRSAIEPTAAGELLGSGTRVVVLGQQTLTDGASIVVDEPAAAAGRSAADAVDPAPEESRS
jgi:multidrug efflux pump subunit AcrA (membrane-fusion protein)